VGGATPSQTVGPFFSLGLDTFPCELVAADDAGALRVEGVVLDGAGEPVPDALVEVWQANVHGRYAHPGDRRDELPLFESFAGFGRCLTDGAGRYRFRTVKPGSVPFGDGRLQAPHVAVGVFARGLLKRLATRMYFPDEAVANAADPVLSALGDDARRTLVARPTGGGVRFDIRLQGARQTTFFAMPAEGGS